MDSNCAGDLSSRRSTIEYVFILTGGPLCWRSMLSSVIVLSTIETEYMVVGEANKEIL